MKIGKLKFIKNKLTMGMNRFEFPSETKFKSINVNGSNGIPALFVVYNAFECDPSLPVGDKLDTQSVLAISKLSR